MGDDREITSWSKQQFGQKPMAFSHPTWKKGAGKRTKNFGGKTDDGGNAEKANFEANHPIRKGCSTNSGMLGSVDVFKIVIGFRDRAQ